MSIHPLYPLPTEPQLEYIRGMQRRLTLSDGALDLYCTSVYGRGLSEMNRHQVSQLIDAMKDWKDIPAEVRRALGQLDMFGDQV